METKQFREHRPGYVSGFENKTYDVKTFDEVLDIEFVKRFSKSENFFSYAVSVDTNMTLPHDDPNRYKMKLMAMYEWDDEYNGCVKWWVVGYLPGFIMYQTNLKNWEDIKASHKPNCWTRKYDGNQHMFGYDRPEESRMKILKELGWPKSDMVGIANYCDCGWDGLRK